MSCCRCAADFEINLKSSAYASGMVRVTTLHRSFTYLIKNRGPSIDPCGTSLVTRIYGDEGSLIVTL